MGLASGVGDIPRRTPGLELTAYSLRCATASGSSSGLAFGCLPSSYGYSRV